MNDPLTKRRFDHPLSKGSFGGADGDGEFQRDRARIIHSAAFRRLQGKTQVLGIGENDFYRTRLTHSLETAQISSGIVASLQLRHRNQPETTQWLPGMMLIEAVGLAHDIGHPPFGHGGEAALNFTMHDHGGFEANGQTLRIVTKLGEYTPTAGLNLTRRTLLGLLKYPVVHQKVARYGPLPEGNAPLDLDPWRPPKCIHDDEADVLGWLLEPFTDADRDELSALTEGAPGGHHRTRHRSLDATIMEYGDDIAYGVHDLEDALALGLISFDVFEHEVLEPLRSLDACTLVDDADFYNEKLFSGSDHHRKHAISRLVGYFIENIDITRLDTFDSPLLAYRAVMRSPAKETLEALKAFVFDWVIRSPEVQALEFRGRQMLLRLFEALETSPKRLLPREVFARYDNAQNRLRVICDYLASMTDTHATKLYLRLFNPGSGSLFEPL